MQKIEVFALASVTGPPENLVIAASRAEATGCIPIQRETDIALARNRLEFIRRHTDRKVGIVVGGVEPGQLSPLLGSEPGDLHFILSADEMVNLDSWAEFFAGEKLPFTAQVTNCDDGVEAARRGAESIILKGSESGGYAGTETAFVLAQRWNRVAGAMNLPLPYHIQGGIGLDTAAAAIACGASGVVLDSQLLLARENRLDAALRKWIESADGSEVSTLGAGLNAPHNFFHRRGSEAYRKLSEAETSLGKSGDSEPEKLSAWRAAVRDSLSEPASGDFFPLGQDICLAKSLAERFVTVGGIISGIRSQVRSSLAAAARLGHLGKGSALAESLGTEYPILQGPMTRVSDTADFAHAVSSGGGLSFLALAVMRKNEVEKLLEETSEKMGGMPWGVGILGFLPPAIRAEQAEVIFKHKPPFAIIAGGRPDQAKQFEDEGISTYIHVPSPGLLETFLRQGARKFIFEGRECGGHVGPRSSFVLWQSACDIVLEQIEKKPVKDLHLIFAGGICDDVSSSMIAAMTAPLAERGVKIGVLMGTAYLFTREAVDCGAIVPRFQKEALHCDRTILLQTGPGHAIRCIQTPYYDVFEKEKNRLIENGASHEDLVRNLEGMNIGRLRVASKGVDRQKTEDSAIRKLVEVPEEEQFDRGMYMIGQIAALQENVMTIADLHSRVSEGGTGRLQQFANTKIEVGRDLKPSDIAIIGMSCYYPDAASLDEYWQNILDRHYAVREIPETHWDWRLFYDEDPKTEDRIISKWGGFLKDIDFDPLRYGITPRSMEVIEPLQLLTLEAVHFALDDAGYSRRPFNRERTACIVGIGGGAGPKSVAYGFRTCMRLADYFSDMPIMSDEIIERAGEVLPDWTEDSFPGFLANICSGRVANRFDLGGPNYAIDAACASSLASLDVCVHELETGNVDMAIAMGADAVQTPLSYMAFSKTHALSQKGHSKPFDAEGDGIVLSEGVGVVVLKRLEDAERDGDKIYAVIKGIGSSSDGKAKGLTAPNADGQARALHRAYEKANLSPGQIELIEAHGTGTVVGDRTEANALATVLKESGAAPQSCALGSVKSMIGHSKCAAGIAGLIKTALALHHKVLPPTLVEEPNPTANFGESSLFLNTELRPWTHSDKRNPRAAGVSAFGFGGTNFHTVLTEYQGNYIEDRESASKHWPTELFTWRGSRSGLKNDLGELAKLLEGAEPAPDFPELAAAVHARAKTAEAGETAEVAVSVIAKDSSDLLGKLKTVIDHLDTEDSHEDPRGIVIAPCRPRPGKIAFLYPGQGSQYPDMLSDLAVNFPQVRQRIDLAGSIIGDRLPKPIGKYLYPPSSFTGEQEKENARQLAQTEVAQPALGACSVALTGLLEEFGVTADAFAGHSYGEYVALHAAGAMTEEQLYEISFLRGLAIRENLENGSGMLAVNAAPERALEILRDEADGVHLANINSPNQTVLSAPESRIAGLEEKFAAADIRAKRLPVACGFHSPFVEKAANQLGRELDRLDFRETSATVFSNSTASRYPATVEEYRSLLKDHLTTAVDFAGMLGAMREDGIDLFIEVGPGSVLTNLCRENIPEGNVEALSVDQKGRSGLTQLQTLLGKLFVLGVPVDTGLLYSIRKIEASSLESVFAAPNKSPKPNSWVVNGVRAKRADQDEPLLLGQPHPDLVSSGKVTEIIQVRNAPKKKATDPAPEAARPAAPKSVATPAPKSQPSSNGEAPPRPTRAASSAKTPVYHSKTPPKNMVNQNLPQPATPNLSNGIHDGTDKVMLGFQNLMSQFLETQRSVMVSYLGGNPTQDNGRPLPAPMDLISQQPHPQPQVPQTQEPAPAAATPPPVNGDYARSNGHAPITEPKSNGVNRLESFAIDDRGPKAENGATPPNGSTPAAVAEETAEEVTESNDVSIEEIRKQLLKLVSERTGYPEEMLDLELDLEADLGIDSIKRVEILGELAEFVLPESTSMEDDGGLNLEKLSGLRSLQQILEYLEEFLESQPVAAGDEKKKVTR